MIEVGMNDEMRQHQPEEPYDSLYTSPALKATPLTIARKSKHHQNQTAKALASFADPNSLNSTFHWRRTLLLDVS
jgi:hypothetical protein